MSKFSKINWQLRLLQLTIVLIPLSYEPQIYLSQLQGLNLEFSFVQIAAILFILSSLGAIYQTRKDTWMLWPLRFLGGFTAFNVLSVLWSSDASRTLVLSAYWVFIFAFVIAIISLFKSSKIAQKDITNPLILGAVLGTIFGFWQFIGGFLNVDPSYTLTISKYNAELFGFARIHSFALEPQFYASTLLAPLFYLSWRVLFQKYRYYHTLLLVWFMTIFLLTVSRGAMLGLIFGMLILLGYFMFKNELNKKLARFLTVAVAILAALVLSLGLIYVSGERVEDHSGLKSVESFIDHMSHEIIDIKLANDGEGTDGFVESSTSGRFYMVDRALDISSDSARNYIIGVGAGSFGPEFHAKFMVDDRIDHVINNQYVEFFTELGIIGLSLFMAFVISFTNRIIEKGRQYTPILFSLFIAYLVQYFFFSLQTNVLHIWAFVGVALGITVMKKFSEGSHERAE